MNFTDICLFKTIFSCLKIQHAIEVLYFVAEQGHLFLVLSLCGRKELIWFTAGDISVFLEIWLVMEQFKQDRDWRQRFRSVAKCWSGWAGHSCQSMERGSISVYPEPVKLTEVLTCCGP